MFNRKSFLIVTFFLLPTILFFSCAKKKNLTDTETEWLQHNDSVTIALFPYYPPYEFINKKNEIVGVFVEYLGLIEQKIDYKFKRKYYTNWPELMDDIRNGKVDIVMQIQATKNRNTYLNFYAELFEAPHVIVTRKGSFFGDRISNFKNKTILVPKDYAIAENLKRKYPKLTFIEGKGDLICLQKLNSGEHDAYIGPKAVVNYLIKSKNLDNLEIASETTLSYKPGFAVHKKNKILNEIIQKGVNNISKAEVQNIYANWLYVEKKPFYKKIDFFLPLIVIILSGFVIVLGINFYLGLIVKKKTKELRIAKEIAEKDDQLKTAFLGNVTQEIRNPMNTIKELSDSLDKPSLTITEKKKHIKKIINSGQQLINSINNILEISQLQTKQIGLDNEKTDVSETLENIFSVFEIKAKKKGISLILNNNLKENQRYAILDNAKLTKIISGLVENAIKFTNKGAVLVSCILQNTTLIITVRDSGIGIHYQDRLAFLEQKTQSKKLTTLENQGLGLGLSIAKENIKLMGGKLSFSSIPNKGSTFKVTLPYHRINDTDTPSALSKKAQNLESKQYTTLIAEDGEVNFLFLKTILEKIEGLDFNIHRAKNGIEAVEFCVKNENTDLVFMDIKMPEMNGYDATKIIKQLHPKLPVIAQTAYSTGEDIQHALKAGCDDFISKPINPIALRKVLESYVSLLTN